MKMNRLEIGFKLDHPNAKIPTKAHPSDAGWDFSVVADNMFFVPTNFSRLYENYKNKNVFILEPHKHHLFSTGIRVEIPPSWCLYFVDRSGLGAKKIVHRTAGLIDSGFSGVCMISLVNLSDNEVVICEGDKIIQGILLPVSEVEWIQKEEKELSLTDRGEGGFGSSDLIL